MKSLVDSSFRTSFSGALELAINRSRWCLFCFFILFAIAPNRWGHAQTTKQREVAAALSSKIMQSIRKHHGGTALQDKAIRRMAECALIYSALSKQAPNQNAKQGAALISQISKEIMFQMSASVSMDQFRKLSKEAHDLVNDISKPQNERSLHWLLRDCQSLIKFDEIDEAIDELAF